MPEPRILVFDIETSLSKGYFFDLWKEGNIVEIESSWYMLSFAWKWLGEKKVHVLTLPDFPGYAKNKSCDKALATALHRLLDEADIVVGHNLDRFDVRKANARFIANGLKPPTPYKTVDTLKIARKYFKFDSNRLDDLGQYLGVGRKKPNTGKTLWLGCMAGDMRCWGQMAAYNRQDVLLDERVYNRLKAWHTSHPSLNNFTRADACPVCQSAKLRRDGFAYLSTGKRQRAECVACGHKFLTGKIIKEAA